MFNQFTGCGRLGRDPEVRQSQSGTTICNLSVACDSGWGDKKETYWAKVVCFGKTAEFCERYLKKGDAVMVIGRVQERKWQDQSGNERWSTEIVADRVQSLGGKQEPGGDGTYGEAASQRTSGLSSSPDAGGYDDLDDEIPF